MTYPRRKVAPINQLNALKKEALKTMYVLHYRDTYSDGSTVSCVIEASTDVDKLRKSIIESVIEAYQEEGLPAPEHIDLSGSRYEFTIDGNIYRYFISPIDVI